MQRHILRPGRDFHALGELPHENYRQDPADRFGTRRTLLWHFNNLSPRRRPYDRGSTNPVSG